MPPAKEEAPSPHFASGERGKALSRDMEGNHETKKKMEIPVEYRNRLLCMDVRTCCCTYGFTAVHGGRVGGKGRG